VRKINFKCPTCGGTQVFQVEIGALLKSPVKELEVAGGVVDVDYEDDGTLIITDETETTMQVIQYECANCQGFLVKGDGKPCRTPEDLFRWLRGEKMLGEEKTNEENIVNSVVRFGT
jgi:hypothetical protein